MEKTGARTLALKVSMMQGTTRKTVKKGANKQALKPSGSMAGHQQKASSKKGSAGAVGGYVKSMTVAEAQRRARQSERDKMTTSGSKWIDYENYNTFNLEGATEVGKYRVLPILELRHLQQFIEESEVESVVGQRKFIDFKICQVKIKNGESFGFVHLAATKGTTITEERIVEVVESHDKSKVGTVMLSYGDSGMLAVSLPSAGIAHGEFSTVSVVTEASAGSMLLETLISYRVVAR